MTILKKFLERRSEILAQERNAKQGEIIEEPIKDKDLTDDEFWEILKQFKLESRSGGDPSEILQEILEHYPVEKINQFAERYESLNK